MTKFARRNKRKVRDIKTKPKRKPPGAAVGKSSGLTIAQIRAGLKFPEMDLQSQDSLRMPLRSVVENGKITTVQDGSGGGTLTYDKLRYPYFCYMAVREGGFTQKQLAMLFFVDSDVIGQWLMFYPAFRKAFDQGRDEFLARELETTLLKKAKGYKYTEKQYTVDSNGNEICKKTKKVMHPDTNAIMFYLMNRHRQRWKSTSALAKENAVEEITDTHPDNPKEVEQSTPESAAKIIDILNEAGAIPSYVTGSNDTQDK